MAKARMCDRCGKCFNPLSETGCMCRFVNPVFQDPEDIRERKVGARLLHGEPPDAYVDLCPNCTTKFVIFMNCGETKGDTDGDERLTNVMADLIEKILETPHGGNDHLFGIWEEGDTND